MSYDGGVVHNPSASLLPTVGGDVPIRVTMGGGGLPEKPISGDLEDLLTRLDLSEDDKNKIRNAFTQESCLGSISVTNNNCRIITKLLRAILDKDSEAPASAPTPAPAARRVGGARNHKTYKKRTVKK